MNNNENKDVRNNDKKTIRLLIVFIVLVSILIVGVGTILVFEFLGGTNENIKISTTTKRDRTSEETKTTETSAVEETTEEVTPTTSSVTQLDTTTKSVTTKTPTTKKSSYSNSSSTKNVIAPTTKIITTTTVTSTRSTISSSSSSNHQYALNDYEWDIVNRINNARSNNGLNRLGVVADFRTLAENAAYKWHTSGKDAAVSMVRGTSNIRGFTNARSDAVDIYNTMMRQVDLTTKREIDYIGVGVVKIPNGLDGLDVYYYVLIYE